MGQGQGYAEWAGGGGSGRGPGCRYCCHNQPPYTHGACDMAQRASDEAIKMRMELTGEDPTLLERLLVQRVVTCWLFVYHLEYKYAHFGDMVIGQGLYFQKAITMAQSRFLKA